MKRYQEILESTNKFKLAFKRDRLFNDICLTESCPCDICEYKDEVTPVHQYDERSIEYKKYCEPCIKFAVWQMDCIMKLGEYEKINTNPGILKCTK